MNVALLRRFRMQCAVVGVLIAAAHLHASDHADPILLFGPPQEQGLTGLFVFPVDADGNVIHAFTRPAGLPLHKPEADIVRQPLTEEEVDKIRSVVFILCIRPQLTNNEQFRPSPYTYRIQIDIDSYPEVDLIKVDAPSAGVIPRPNVDESIPHSHNEPPPMKLIEAYARYGGRIPNFREIEEDITLEFKLNNNGTIADGYPIIESAGADPSGIVCEAGIFDDPFIFPMFSDTNVVAITATVPVEVFRGKTDLLVWGTTHKKSKKIDHVGRALRTQNPRFEMLNRLRPREHVDALLAERNDPGLIRDLALKFNLSSLFAYREWDFVPDVACYSTRYPAGFPNGRLLSDDIAAMLAQHGDVVLFELSHAGDDFRWPRTTKHDPEFHSAAPYLTERFGSRPQPSGYRLSVKNKLLLLAIFCLALVLYALSVWVFARLYYKWKVRKRYL